MRHGKSWSNSWNTTALSGPGARLTRPATEIVPPTGAMKPAIAFRIVDFPHPDGPISINFSRVAISKVASPTAVWKLRSTQ